MNAFEILGVSKTANDEEIKKAWKDKAKLYHPDTSKVSNAQEKFLQAKDAFDKISNYSLRKQYLLEIEQKEEVIQRKEYYRPTQEKQNNNFDDVFNSFRQNTTNQEIVEIEMNEAYCGTLKTIRYPTGSIDVRIPPGVKTGNTLRVKQDGKEAVCVIRVKSNPRFELKTNDLHTTLFINPIKSMIGGKAQFLNLDGRIIPINIPKGTSYGTIMKLGGYGWPSKPPGDLFITIGFEIPKNINKEQQELLEKLDRLFS